MDGGGGVVCWATKSITAQATRKRQTTVIPVYLRASDLQIQDPLVLRLGGLHPRKAARLEMLENLRPLYAKKFRCVGAECEDVCCRGWEVPIGRTTYQKYESLPALRSRLQECFDLIPHSENEKRYARIKLTPSGTCPFLGEEGLCVIHKNHGEEYLSEICANYPRCSRRIDGLIEKPLTLSCPEAARLVLLDPELQPGYRRRDGDRGYGRLLALPVPPLHASGDPLRFFWNIREFTLLLIQDPIYPLWQRLFILGMFCKKLDERIAEGKAAPIARLLRDYAQMVVDGRLKEGMDGIPARTDAQVTMVLETVHRYLARARLGRIRECLEDFLSGIQFARTTTMETWAKAYAEAYSCYYAPFLQQHPHVFENWLTNYVFRNRFPFGEVAEHEDSMQNEYVFLCLEFAIIKGLLIGIAGHYREEFCLDQVVKVVQSAAKVIEHYEPLRQIINWKGLADPISMAALLKN